MSSIETLNYCKEMLNNESSYEDALLRNVVSRAYYSAFYQLMHNMNNRLGWVETNKKGGVHIREISKLLGYPETSNLQKIEDAKVLHNRMLNLKKLRTKADYKIDQSVERVLAEYAVFETEQICNELNSL